MHQSRLIVFLVVVMVTLAIFSAAPISEPSVYAPFAVTVPAYLDFPVISRRNSPMDHFKTDASIGIPDLDLIRLRFKTQRLYPDLDETKGLLEEYNLSRQPNVQKQLRLARLGSQYSQQRARFWLAKQIINYQQTARQLGDPYMPYATVEQIGNHKRGIHILDQAYNEIPMHIDPVDDFVMAGLILGTPGGGKSSAAFVLARQFPRPILILDPKNAWRHWASALSAKIIEPQYLNLDLDKPENSNISEEDYLFAEMQAIAQITGLQYGLDPLVAACKLALEQKRRYQCQWNTHTPLCLKDIALCLPLTGFKGPRRADYLASAQTALNLILGPKETFASTRQGLPLERILQGNYIIPCHHLNSWQCRYLAIHLMHFLHFRSLGQPEKTSTHNLLIIDDASNFISKPESVFGSGSSISPYHYLLKTLRSSGAGWIFLDQTPMTIAEDIRQLCNFWLITGSITNTRNHAEVASALSLTPAQAQYLGYMQKQECIAYCPYYYPRPVHGRIPDRSQYL